jgi:hypothetical protein
VLSVISFTDGILHCKIIEGLFCTKTFQQFINGLLKVMEPHPGPKHQYSHNFLVGTCTGLYKPVQALKAESLQEKQAMSDFAQVWFHFIQQVKLAIKA